MVWNAFLFFPLSLANMTEITFRRPVLVYNEKEGCDEPFWELTRGVRDPDENVFLMTSKPLYKPRERLLHAGEYGETDEKLFNNALIGLPVASPESEQFWVERKEWGEDASAV